MDIKIKTSRFIRKNRYHLILFVLIFLATVSQIVWIKLNAAPPMMWDDAGYLIHSLNNYYTLIDDGMLKFVQIFTQIITFHPPLITILPIPFYFIFGNSTFSSLLVYTFFIVTFCIYLFLLTKEILNERVALLAVTITSLFPLTYGLWRQFMIEFGLVTLVVTYLFYLIKSNEFRELKYIIPLGIIGGLGLLMKETFPIFIIGPTIYFLIQAILHLKKERILIFARNITLLLFLSLLIAGPWYVKNFQKMIEFGLRHAFREAGKPWSLGPILSWRTLIDYWTNIINFGISSYFFWLMVILVVSIILLRKRVFSQTALWFLGSWFLVPFSIFSMVVFKEVRHILSILPVLGIVIGAFLDNLLFYRKRKKQVVLYSLLSLFPLFNFFYLSFDLPSNLRKDINCGPFVLFKKDLHKLSQAQNPLYTFPINREKWPLEQIIQIILEKCDDNDNPYVLMAVEHPYFNGCTLEYQTLLSRVSLRINDIVMLGGKEEIINGIFSCDFLITKTGHQGPKFVNSWNQWVQEKLDKKEFQFEEISRVALPDQSEALIYKNFKNKTRTGGQIEL